MRLAAQLRHRLRSLLHRAAVEQELDEEIRYHVERQLEADIAKGVSYDEALLTARRATTGIEARKEECRDVRGLNVLDNVWRDIRFAIRQLQKTPTFAGIAVLVLALGLSAAVAIFAYVDAALIKPLPYPDPTRLVGVTETAPMIPRANLSYHDYLDWKRMNRVFRSLDAYNGTGYLLDTPSGVQPVSAARVSGGFFRTLGIRLFLGRDFEPGEDLPGAAKSVILTWPTWMKRYGGRREIVGQTLSLSGVSYTVIGVLPQEFQFAPLGRAEVVTPLDSGSNCSKRRSCHNLYGLARLNDGVSVRAALDNMTSIAQELERQYPDSNRGQGASVLPLTEVVVGQIRPILLVLITGAGLLLLIACANVASLLLVRAEHRRREITIRGAVGASSSRLLSQFVTEGLVLSLAGGVLGLLFARWTIPFLLTLIPANMLTMMPFLGGSGLNLRVILCAIGILLVAAAIFSLAPAAHFSLSKMREGLVEASRGSAGLSWRRLGARLVVFEFAAAMVLLAGAGLLGKSLYHLLRVDLKFQPDHLATLTVAAPDTKYGKSEQSTVLGQEIVKRASSVPGVVSAEATSTLPVSFNGNTQWIRFVGKPYNGEHIEVNAREVNPAYFTTIEAKLLRGRHFTEFDNESSRRVIIVNQKLVQQYFPGEDPIGKQIGNTSLSPDSLREIVGVVDDIREGSLNSQIWPAVYYPFAQSPDTYFSLVVRTSQDPAAVLPAISAAVRRLYPDAGVGDEITMEDRIYMSQTASLHRFAAWLVGGFAGLALLLGVVGLYGVVAYAVSQRTREIGVRMALGAAPKSVYQLILQEAARLVAIAAVLGLAASVASATLMRGLFYEVRSWDIPMLGIVTAILMLAALLASYIPARRAALVDPAVALRAE